MAKFSAALIGAVLLVARAQASAVLPRATCKSLSASSQIYSFNSNNLATRNINDPNNQIYDRTYDVHIPAAYNEQIPHAVVLSFHGHKGSKAGQLQLSQLAEQGLKINNVGIISVFPRGKDGTDGESAWLGAYYANQDAHDVIFVNRILDELTANLCVDTSRIYASGKSNGGGFVNRLACTPSTSARIAAFALVSSALYPETRILNNTECQSSSPNRAPVLISHGTADGTIPYEGRKYRAGTPPTDYTADIDAAANWWAGRNKVNNLSTNFTVTTNYRPNVVKKVWPKTGLPRVVRLKVTGLGHSWPNTKGYDNANVSYAFTSLDLIPFFNDYTLSTKW